jgi:hypothetical protein
VAQQILLSWTFCYVIISYFRNIKTVSLQNEAVFFVLTIQICKELKLIAGRQEQFFDGGFSKTLRN